MSNNTASRRPRVVLAEDDALLRYTIKLIVEKDCEVVGEADNGGAAVELAEQLRPNVVLLDNSMPVLTGMEAGRQIREKLPDVRVIIVSNYTDTAHIEAVTVGRKARTCCSSAAAAAELGGRTARGRAVSFRSDFFDRHPSRA